MAVAVVFLRHFYNQNFLPNVVDHGSTFTLQYTPTLRPFVLGKLVVQSINLVVPKQTMDHHVQVLCPKECNARNGQVRNVLYCVVLRSLF